MDFNQLLENELLEFKRELPANKQLAKEIVAFANTKGGQIIIGYDGATKKVLGVEPKQETEEKIANLISDLCAPHIDYFLSYETADNTPILVITIKEGAEKPYRIKGKSLEKGVYIRVGSTTRLASLESLSRLIRQGKNLSYDIETVDDEIAINKSRVQEYLDRRHARFGASIPRITKSLLSDLYLRKGNNSTIAGALLFSDHPQTHLTLEHAYIKAARFRGKSKGLFLDQQEILGPLPLQIDQATKFVLRNIALRGVIKGTKRIEQYEYPPEVVRELIVNAVIHRDYSRSGSCILLAVYDDRIEVVSPGGLAGPVTVDNIADRQFNRNPIIAKRMFEFGYFDSWGQGIDRIIRWSNENTSQPPLFIDEVSQFTAIIYSKASDFNAKSTNSQIEEKALALFKEHGKLTNRLIREKLKLSKSQAQTLLRKLSEQKLITLHGKGRAIYYTR